MIWFEKEICFGFAMSRKLSLGYWHTEHVAGEEGMMSSLLFSHATEMISQSMSGLSRGCFV
jgi:hypothetical protein